MLNPVRAGLVPTAADWPWSSYRAMIGAAPVPSWLAVDGLLSQFGETREEARRGYQRFVGEGMRGWRHLGGAPQQVYLGDSGFVERMQAQARICGDALSVPKVQRRAPAPALDEIKGRHPDRNAAIRAAYATGAYSYREIAQSFGIHLASVGRIVRRGLEGSGPR